MKAMVFSDLITARNSFGALLGITVFVAAFIAVGSGTLLVAAACMTAMVPFMYLFSISAYDEQNGWERFRLTLPISRRQVAYGRYLSMLIITGIAVILSLLGCAALGLVADVLPAGMVAEGLMLSHADVEAILVVVMAVVLMLLFSAAFTLPLVLRFGMTRGARIVPVVLMLALSAIMVLAGSDAAAPGVQELLSGPHALIMAGAFIVMLVLYGVSAWLSGRRYEHRDI